MRLKSFSVLLLLIISTVSIGETLQDHLPEIIYSWKMGKENYKIKNSAGKITVKLIKTSDAIKEIAARLLGYRPGRAHQTT